MSNGLREALPSMSSPMVLVGCNQLAATYREVNTYDNLLSDAVTHNPEQLSVEQLHDVAWPILEKHLLEQRSQAVDRFHSLKGTGRVSHELTEVVEAARQGRIDTLFVTADPWCWEQVSKHTRPVFALGKDDAFADCERVYSAATETMLNGGQVYVTTQRVVPEGEVEAIYRY